MLCKHVTGLEPKQEAGMKACTVDEFWWRAVMASPLLYMHAILPCMIIQDWAKFEPLNAVCTTICQSAEAAMDIDIS